MFPQNDTGLAPAHESLLEHELARLQHENERLRARCRELELRVRLQGAQRIGAVVRAPAAA